MTTNNLCWALSALVLILALYASHAKAETSAFAGAWSTHPFSDEEYNEEHRLVAVEHESVFFGYFRNSYNEDTFAAAYSFHKWYGPIKAGVYVGGMYGYRDCLKGYSEGGRKVCPMVAPYITWDTGPVNPQLFLLGEAIAVSIRIGL